MTTQYETLRPEDSYREAFGVQPPAALPERMLWPRKAGGFIVHQSVASAWSTPDASAAPDTPHTPAAESAAAAEEAAPNPVAKDRTRVLVSAQWGLVPHWVKSASDAKLRAPKLATAKSDLLATGTAFRDAWLAGQRCIVPVQAFYADDHRKGKPVPTRIARVDGKPMGLAGVWARWQGGEGEEIISYALITVNAATHGLMNRYQPPGSEKSMPAILNEGAYDAWLQAKVEKAKEFLRLYPAQSLLANPVETKADKAPKGWLE